MNIVRHGLSIGIERTEKHFFMSLKATGKSPSPLFYRKMFLSPVDDTVLTIYKD